MRVPFSLASSVHEDINLNEMTCLVFAKPWLTNRSMHFVKVNLTFKTSVKMQGDQLEILLSVDKQ